MTKKHFEALAQALANSRPGTDYEPDTGSRLRQWLDDVDEIVEVLAGFNPLFDRARFVEACNEG